MNFRVLQFLFVFLISSVLTCHTISCCCTLNHTHALILARGGSKGIQNKNLLKFNGKTILARTIEIIRNTGKFAQVWVSTDKDEIEVEALKHGAVVYRRLPAFAQDHSKSLEAVREFLYKHPYINRFALFQCTSIFLKEKYILEAVEKFRHFPCVFAAKRSHQLRWKELEHNALVPLNFNPFQRPRRQDWNGELLETGMFYFSTKHLVGGNSFQNEKCSVVEINAQDAIEIDTIVDFQMAQCIEKWNGET